MHHFIARVDGKPAALAIVGEGSKITSDAEVFDMD